MCGERNVDGGGAAGWLPAVGAMRGGRRPCDEEMEMAVAVKDDDELPRYCKREEKTLPASRTAPAPNAIKNRRAKKPTKDEQVAAEKEKGKKAGRPAKNKHGFRGVHRRPSGRWGAEIRDVVKGFRVWIGTYDTVEAAALAYDAEARRIHGGNAKTNFPPTPPPADPGAVAGNNKKKRQKAPVPAPTVAMEAKTKTKPVPAAAAEMVTAPIASEWWAGEAAVDPVLLAHPLEATDGWEFEPYSMGLLGGVALLDINNTAEPDDELGGATSNAAADASLWNF